MLLAARSPRGKPDAAAIKLLLRDEIDWHAFLAVTQRHRLSPLVLLGLQPVTPGVIPPFVMAELQVRQQANRDRVLRIHRELQRLLRRFGEHGWQLSALKGAMLSETIYGDPFRRHSGDLDLLTEDRDLPAQVELLRTLGYVQVTPDCRLTPRRLARHQRYWKDLTFCHRPSGRSLDLHWRLFNNREHRANQLGARLVPAEGLLFGAGLSTIGKTDQFLYCAAHGTADDWVYLKGLADVAAFLRVLTAEELAEALGRAEALGLLPQVSSAIHLAAEWMGAPVPAALTLGADDPFHQRLRRRVWHELVRTEFQPLRHNPGALAALRRELCIVPGARSLIEILGRYLWRPRIWSRVDLPDALLWLYPVLGLLTPPRRVRRGGTQMVEPVAAGAKRSEP